MILDGRYLSVETTCTFGGRVVGFYCQSGQLSVNQFKESDL